MAKISVVIPIYGVENYLLKCVDSVFAQTFKDIEIILVDDGGKDACPKMCDEIALKDNRVKVIHKKNGGLSDARNAGMAIATSKYIYFLDSDDFLEPDCLKLCYEKLEETGADMVIFDIYQYFMKTNIKECIANKYDDRKTYSVKGNPEILTCVLNAAWNKMVRLSLFKNNDIEYPYGYYYEDLGTTYRLMLMSKSIAFINKPLYNYLADRPGNITTQFNYNIYHVLGMVKINLDFYKKHGDFDTYYEELKFLGGVNIIECLKKTRTVKDRKMVNEFIDVCFYEIYKNFPDFPKCKYPIIRQKHDWIYANKLKLKSYLALRNWFKK